MEELDEGNKLLLEIYDYTVEIFEILSFDFFLRSILAYLYYFKASAYFFNFYSFSCFSSYSFCTFFAFI